MKNKITSITAILTLIGICFATYFYIDNRYALAEGLKKVEQRLDYKVTSDQLDSVQNRIWQIEDRYKDINMNETVKEELRMLKDKKEKLSNKLNIIEKKGEQNVEN